MLQERFWAFSAVLRDHQAWIEIHKEDLLADWELAVTGQPPLPIDTLR